MTWVCLALEVFAISVLKGSSMFTQRFWSDFHAKNILTKVFANLRVETVNRVDVEALKSLKK